MIEHETTTAPAPDGIIAEPIALTRRPIFTIAGELSGYAIRLASDDLQTFGGDPTPCARSAMHAALHGIGLDALFRGQTGFIPVTAAMVSAGEHTLLPPDRVRLELMDDVPLQQCRDAKRAGYVLTCALESAPSRAREILGLVQTLTCDIENVPTFQESIRTARGRGQSVVATGVETREVLRVALEAGVTHVQGEAFSRPERVERRSPKPVESSRLRLLSASAEKTLDYDEFERVLRSDFALVYQLLRYVNSAAMGVRTKVESIRQAMALIGERSLRRWAALAGLVGLGVDRCDDLLVTSIVRARYCERLGEAQGLSPRAMEFFLVGLLASIDAVTEMPIEHAIEGLPLSEDAKAALLGDQENVLARTYALAHATERGGWRSVAELCDALSVSHRAAAIMYYETLNWAHEAMLATR